MSSTISQNTQYGAPSSNDMAARAPVVTLAPAPVPLPMQKSSWAGYLGLFAAVSTMISQQGMPVGVAGWLGLAGMVIPSLFSIVTNENGPSSTAS